MLYSTEQAAEYCQMSVAAIKYHIHRAKDLKGQLIGNSYIFTRDDLDSFLKNKREQGRPVTKSKPQR